MQGVDHLEINPAQFDKVMRSLIFKLQVFEMSEQPVIKFSQAVKDISKHLGVELDMKKYDSIIQ